MVRACLGLLAGMYALQLSSFGSDSDYLSVVVVATVMLLLVRQWQLAATFLLGASVFLSSAWQLREQRIDPRIAGDSMVIQVDIVDFPRRRDSQTQFRARPVNAPQLPSQIRLSWYQPPVDLRINDRWHLEVRLRRPRGPSNPNGFDVENWLFRERIAATGYVVNSHRNHLLRSPPAMLVDAWRQRFVSRVERLVRDPEQAAVLAAIVVGARHQITAAQWQRYATTGTSHLMAISGLHIGLAALGSYYLLLIATGFFAITVGGRNHHRLAVGGSVLAAIAYAQLSGLAVPASRASLMLALAGILLIARRRPDGVVLLATVGGAIALLDPLATMSPGFMLSFAAVAILIWLQRCRRQGLYNTQLALLTGLMPLTVLLFDRISLVALAVNLIALPVFSLLSVPLALAGLLLDGPFAPIGDAAIRAAATSIGGLESLLQFAANVPLAAVTVADLGGAGWLYGLLPLLWAAIPRGWPGRALAVLGIVGLVLYRPAAPAAGCARLTFLDVGQGLAVVMQTAHRVLIYDTGAAYRGGGSAAASVLLPYLGSRGIRYVDQLVISHADLDHAGGVTELREQLPIGLILAGEPLAGHWSLPCKAGQRWQFDAIDLQVLHPAAATLPSGNDSSCVLLLTLGSARVLLTGDIEAGAEQRLLQRGILPPVDIVSVPHHGSNTSSSLALVAALDASFAVVSAGYRNHWGQPTAAVVQRWQQQGAVVLNTATAGAVEFDLCADTGVQSHTEYRAVRRRIWHE